MPYTKDQQKAIDTRDKNILVAAAAGSGKTSAGSSDRASSGSKEVRR